MASFARSPAPRAGWTIAEAALFAARKEYELLRLLSADKKALATARRLGLPFGQAQPHTQPHPPAAPAGIDAAAPPADAADGASAAAPVLSRRARRRAARCAQRTKPAQPHTQTPSDAAAAEGGAPAPQARVARPAEVRADDAAPRANARRLRSAARSARHHAGRQRRIRTAAHILIFLLRLRRRALLRRAYVEFSSDEMSVFSTRVSVDSMEDAWATPLPSRSASSKRERSDSPPSRSAGSSAGCTPPSPGSCASYEPPEECADGLCEMCDRCAREGRWDHQRLRREALAMLLAPS